MADSPKPPDKPPPPPRPPENLKPTPQFQQKLDDFRAQKDAKMDSGELRDTRGDKAANQEKNAAHHEAKAQQRNQDRPAESGRAEPRRQQRPVEGAGAAAPQRPADGAGGAASQRPVDASRGEQGAAANESRGLRPTPEFQQKLDDFRAQKEAKMDSGQLEDTRDKKASNQVENAANREARAQQRRADSDKPPPAPEQAGARQTAAAEKTSPQQDGTAAARTPEQTDDKTTRPNEPQVPADGSDRKPPGSGDRNPPSPPGGDDDRNLPGPPGEYNGPERRQHPAQHLDPAHDLRRQAPERDDVPRATTDDPPRPGDRGFDPGEHRGELRNDFRPGTHDPEGRFTEKERAVADRLAEDGASVHPRKADHTVKDKKNPEGMVRTSPEDPGTVTEFKTLKSGSPSAVKRNLLEAGVQVKQYGGGDAVIDGRNVNLTDQDARRGYARAVGEAKEFNKPMPERVMVILGDGSIKVFPEE